MKLYYDVVIIGGGTAGCSCAWNSARLGLKTLLIEKENYLGGTMTGSLVVPVMKSGNNQINTDFYKKLILEMRARGGQVTYLDNPGWFNPILLKSVLKDILFSEGVDILFNCSDFKVDIGSHIVSNLYLSSEILSVNIDTIHTNNLFAPQKGLSVCIEAKYFVDATGNLNFSKKINCKILKNFNSFQPVSLRFIMGNINLDKFGKWLLDIDSDRDVTTVETIDGHTHLSTAYTWDTDKHWALAPYFNDAVANNILKDVDRNYFQVFTVAGMPDSLAFNCPRIPDKININDEDECKKAYLTGKEMIARLEKFCQMYFPGFENSNISFIAEKLGIRSGDRIKGKYIYTIDDLRSGKKFKNPALISDYPVDIHSNEKNTSTLEKNGEYQLPIESLMSYEYDNLFVAGKCLSADEFAQGALRVQSSCFSMGEAVAKYIKTKINNDVLF